MRSAHNSCLLFSVIQTNSLAVMDLLSHHRKGWGRCTSFDAYVYHPGASLLGSIKQPAHIAIVIYMATVVVDYSKSTEGG